MAPGINCALEVFQTNNTKSFGHLRTVSEYFDDILCASVSEKEHDEDNTGILRGADVLNIKFNIKKLQYK